MHGHLSFVSLFTHKNWNSLCNWIQKFLKWFPKKFLHFLLGGLQTDEGERNKKMKNSGIVIVQFVSQKDVRLSGFRENLLSCKVTTELNH